MLVKQSRRLRSQGCFFPAQYLRSTAFWWHGPAYFCEQIPEDLIVRRQISVHAFEPLVFFFQIFHPFNIRSGAAVLALSIVKRGIGSRIFTAKLFGAATGFLMFENGDNLRLCKSCLLHDDQF